MTKQLKWSIRQKIGLGFALSLLFMLVIGVSSYRTTRILIEHVNQRNHIHHVIEKLDEILLSLLNAETAVRGYVITEQKDFLQPYGDSVVLVSRQIQALQDLTADNASQQGRLAVLRPLTERKLQSLAQQIELRRSQGRTAAEQEIGAVGKQAMDRVRSVLGDMREEELGLLGIRDVGAR